MLMDPAALEEAMLAGDAERRIAPVSIRHDVNITPLTPFEFSKFVWKVLCSLHILGVCNLYSLRKV